MVDFHNARQVEDSVLKAAESFFSGHGFILASVIRFDQNSQGRLGCDHSRELRMRLGHAVWGGGGCMKSAKRYGVSPERPQHVTDWGFYADDPRGALNGSAARWCFWWDDEVQARFEQAWGNDASAVADELADRYAYVWPWMIPDLLPAHAPDTEARIEFLLAGEFLVRRTEGTNPRAVFASSTTWGAFHTVRKRRTWAPPRWRRCPICEAEFFGGEPPIWTYRQFGPSRYCTSCCFRARDGNRDARTPEEVTSAVRELAAAFETIPPQAYSFELLPLEAPEEYRDRIMRALCAMPPVETVMSVLSAPDWLGVLVASGLVEAGWRPSLGTWCRATDGHRCRSLLEKSIDDWFTAHGVAHESEPPWPGHPTLNPSGRRRADWRLPSGAYVECVGMLADSNYRQKVKEKKALADALGIRLYLVVPSDLLDLGTLFSEELPTPPLRRPWTKGT